LTQAELEQFVDPESEGPDLSAVADVTLPLYPAEAQEDPDGGVTEYTVREAVEAGVVSDEWIAYYLGVAKQWYDRVGVDLDRFRFRQHLPGELAHYSADCWDAESLVGAEPADGWPGEDGADGNGDGGNGEGDDGSDDPSATVSAWAGGDWIEIAGFSYRSDYDLSKHAEATDDSFTVFREYDEPKTVERATVDPDMSVLGPEFGGQAGAVRDALETLAERDPGAFDGEEVTVTVDGDEVTVDADVANFTVEEVTEAGEHVTPHVVEPSFGVDRTVLTLLDHAYREDVVSGERRTYLDLDPEVAPTAAAVFPLVSNDDRLLDLADRVAGDLREAGLAVTRDDSGSIGRRYRRQDEVGTPFCVTVDRDGIEGDGPDTVTVRERDSAAQVRLPVDEVAAELETLVDPDDPAAFDDLRDRYERVAVDVDG
jgi:glycyl-tRNA synthetase